MTLDWWPLLRSLEKEITTKATALLAADIPPVRALHLIQTVIKPKITYCLAIAPLSRAQLDRLDRLLCRIAKQCLLLPKSFPVRGTLMPRDQGGIGVTSLLVDTAQACAQLLTRVLNDTNNTNTDPSSLAIIAATSMRRQLDGLGHLPSHLARQAIYKNAMILRQLSFLHQSGVALRVHGTILNLAGNPMWQQITQALSPAHTPLSDLPRSIMLPLWLAGIHDLHQLLAPSLPGSPPTLIATTSLGTAPGFQGRVHT
jgi:hypothetical protein